jgi:hypothetical protein
MSVASVGPLWDGSIFRNVALTEMARHTSGGPCRIDVRENMRSSLDGKAYRLRDRFRDGPLSDTQYHRNIDQREVVHIPDKSLWSVHFLSGRYVTFSELRCPRQCH